MKTAVISDIHANLEALQAVLAHAREQGADEFICLGDVVGYNADPAACVDLLRGMSDLRCILGNHDAMAVGEGPLLGINAQALAAILWTRDQLSDDHKSWLAGLPLIIAEPDVTYCHAALDEPSAWHYVNTPLDAARHFVYQDTRLSFMGHSHMMFAWEEDGERLVRSMESDLDITTGDRWLVSVGSVGQPRDGDSCAGYAMYHHEAGRVVQHRLEYDIATAQRKILAAGLPPDVAARLG